MSAKWGPKAHKFLVWQVMHEEPAMIDHGPPFKSMIHVELISAGLKGPEVDDMLSMRDPAQMERTGYSFRVLAVDPQPGYRWNCLLETLSLPGFDHYPGHITPLAFTKKLQPKPR